jgi:palmitoyltransferase ZDHHC6
VVSWPPDDPFTNPDADQDHQLTLPSTPWTYNNGSLNPDLQPSNTYRRSATTAKRHKSEGKYTGVYTSIPPYHPDYESSDHEDESASTSSHGSYDDLDAYDTPIGNARVRRGSEGYEVQPVDREAIFRRLVQRRGFLRGMYPEHVPQPEGGRDDEVDGEDVKEDAPLSQHVE